MPMKMTSLLQHQPVPILFVIITTTLHLHVNFVATEGTGFEWRSEEPVVRAMVGDDVTFHWEFWSPREHVTEFRLSEYESGDGVVTAYQDSTKEEYNDYKGRTAIVMFSQDTITLLLKSTTKHDARRYNLELSGPGQVTTVQLILYEDANLYPRVLFNNKPNSSLSFDVGSEVIVSVLPADGIESNVTMLLDGEVIQQCPRLSLCSAVISSDEQTNMSMLVKVNYGFHLQTSAFEMEWKTPSAPVTNDDQQLAITLGVVIPVVVVVTVVLVIWCVWRRRKGNRDVKKDRESCVTSFSKLSETLLGDTEQEEDKITSPDTLVHVSENIDARQEDMDKKSSHNTLAPESENVDTQQEGVEKENEMRKEGNLPGAVINDRSSNLRLPEAKIDQEEKMANESSGTSVSKSSETSPEDTQQEEVNTKSSHDTLKHDSEDVEEVNEKPQFPKKKHEKEGRTQGNANKKRQSHGIELEKERRKKENKLPEETLEEYYKTLDVQTPGEEHSQKPGPILMLHAEPVDSGLVECLVDVGNVHVSSNQAKDTPVQSQKVDARQDKAHSSSSTTGVLYEHPDNKDDEDL